VPGGSVSPSERDRSFSDREVALVLRRAAEIESTESGTPGGVSRNEIVAIADEAGIGSAAVTRAIEELSAHEGRPGSAFFPPSSRRTTRVVPRELTREALARLVQRVEDRIGRPGTVTEALGTVRWTSKSGLWTTQVTLDSTDEGTRVGVHDRLQQQGGRAFYVLPGFWGGMIAFGVAMSVGLATVPVTGIVVGGTAVGSLIGRTVLDRLSRRSRDRVERWAGELAEDAREIGGGS